MKHKIQNSAFAYLLAFLVGGVSTAYAAPGDLSQSPLFLQSSVAPNVFILNDNSGSMLWELMTPHYLISGKLSSQSDGELTNNDKFTVSSDTPDIIHHTGCADDLNNDGIIDGSGSDSGGGGGGWDGSGSSVSNGTESREYDFIVQTTADTCNIVAEEEWRARLSDYNAVYYDPTREYKPWAGVDRDGNPFENASVTAAKLDPYNPDSATFGDLTTLSAVISSSSRATYFTSTPWKAWCDDTSKHPNNGTNGVIAYDDCKGWRYYTWTDTNEDSIIDNNELTITWVRDLPAVSQDEINPDSQQNFANWFTYHRSREYAAKYALSQTIDQTSMVRIGYGTINSSDSNKILVDYPDMLDSLSDPTTHKEDVLIKLFNTTSDGGTPLRTSLKAAGEYYKTGDFFGELIGSPILSAAEGGACQSNNTILMTDGFYNGVSPSVGDNDGDNDTDYDGSIYADSYSDTLADVAMQYYENNLSGLPDYTDIDLIKKLVHETDYYPDPDLTDDIEENFDTAGHQHMNTHTLAFGLTGTLDTSIAPSDADFAGWPDPLTDDPLKRFEITETRIDDLFHAAVNGRGNYFSASNPDELVQALLALLDSFNVEAQSATSVAMSSFQLKSESLIYSSLFNTGTWDGNLLAQKIIFEDDGTFSFPDEWNAASNITYSGREIITYNGTTGVPFQWGADGCTTDCISGTMKNLLTDGDTEANIGKARLEYLRGKTAAVIKTDYNIDFRQRDLLLGDIVNSSPVYVAAPASSFPDSDPYGEDLDGKRYFDFWNSKKGRTPVIYVGSNDGMLHGFNAATGAEELAYVPATVFPDLHNLTDPNYIHQYFVDQTPTVADAYFNSDWHTVLVSGLGAGGRGLFALDITDPSVFNETNANDIVLWEFNASTDNDLGYTMSKPVIGLMKDGRWAAIAGNGYNSDSGKAILFIIYLDADLSDGSWDLNTDYRKISTEFIDDSDITNLNGLSSPTPVDTNGDGYVDRAYAGDLKGNLWVFDLNDSTPGNWDVAYKDGTTPQPLFQAINKAGQVQPITVKPSIIRHPHQPTVINSSDMSANTFPNLMIYFGTGQYLTSNDLNDTETQTFYGVWDKGEAFDQDSTALTRKNLVEKTINSGTDSVLDITARITSNEAVIYGDTDDRQRFGWRIDLDTPSASTGERVVTNAVIINDIVFFTTYIPNNDPCGTGGSSWFMFVNAHNGGIPDEPVINLNNDRTVDVNDKVNLTIDSVNKDHIPSGLLIEGGTLGAPTLDMGDGETGTAILNTTEGLEGYVTDVGAGALGKRISWRELRAE